MPCVRQNYILRKCSPSQTVPFINSQRGKHFLIRYFIVLNCKEVNKYTRKYQQKMNEIFRALTAYFPHSSLILPSSVKMWMRGRPWRRPQAKSSASLEGVTLTAPTSL